MALMLTRAKLELNILEETLDTTNNSSLGNAAISAVDSSPIQALTGPPQGASAADVSTTGASRTAITAMPQAESTAFNLTDVSSSITTVVPILKPKPVPSIANAGDKVI